MLNSQRQRLCLEIVETEACVAERKPRPDANGPALTTALSCSANPRRDSMRCLLQAACCAVGRANGTWQRRQETRLPRLCL